MEKRVLGIFGVEKDVIYSKGRRKIQVNSSKKSAVLLGRTRAKTYGHRISQTLWDDAIGGESYAVICGEQMAKKRNYNLV